MKYKLSVIVPIYNKERTLKTCVDSIRRQNVSNMEIILVDDGSTDASLKVCNELALIDKRIKVLHQQNKGVSSARNKGLEVSCGEYIAFVDSDDYLIGEIYSVLINDIERYNADFIGFKYKYTNEAELMNDEKEYTYFGNYSLEILDNKDAIISFLLDKFPGKKMPERYNTLIENEYHHIISGFIYDKIYSKSAIGDIRFDETLHMAEDTLFMAEILQRCSKVILTDISGYAYVYYPESHSRVPAPNIIRGYYYMAYKYNKLFECKYAELHPLILNTYAYMMAAVLNRLLGNYKTNAPEIIDILFNIREEIKKIRSDQVYKSVDFKLRVILFIDTYLFSISKAMAFIFKEYRKIENRLRFEKG